LVGRMLSPNPDDRPQRGQEVAAELADISRQYGIESSSPSIAYLLQQMFPTEAGRTTTDQHQVPNLRELSINPYDSTSSTNSTHSTASQSGQAGDGSVSPAPPSRSRPYSTSPPSGPVSVRPVSARMMSVRPASVPPPPLPPLPVPAPPP